MSGFDENPFGEPVFDDPFKVSPIYDDFHHIFASVAYLISLGNDSSSIRMRRFNK
jgi:hypothetical protein